MTTILVSKREMAMAADRQCTSDDGYKNIYQPKITRIVHETTGPMLFATSGKINQTAKFEHWFREALDTPGKKHNEAEIKDMRAIVFKPDGTLLLYEGSLTPFELQDEIFGIGSGSHFGIGAMLHGADLKEAIRIASLCDVYTGLGIQYESFKHISSR